MAAGELWHHASGAKGQNTLAQTCLKAMCGLGFQLIRKDAQLSGKKGAHPNDTKHREDGTTLKVFGSAFYNGLRPICVEERQEPIPRSGSPMRMGLH